jgi:formylglycine-generating enzyme required for sulfatase activity
MDRIKRLLAAALFVSALLALATCDNPVDMLGELEVKVMKANDRYLKVLNVSIPLSDGTFSPTGSFEITFDRDIDATSVDPTTVIIRKTISGASVDYPPSGVTYFPATKTLRVRVYPYLEADTDFIIEITGVKGADGSILFQAVNQSFKTRRATAGTINVTSIDPISHVGFSNLRSVNTMLTVNDVYGYIKYRLDYSADGGATWTTGTPTAWASRPGDGRFSQVGFSLTAVPEGPVTVKALIWGNTIASDPGFEGIPDEQEIVVDLTPPNPPSVTGVSTSISRRPIWSWSSGGGGGNSKYRLQLNSTGGAWTDSVAQSFTPGSDLALGNNALYVQERDNAGNWSVSGSKVINIIPCSVTLDKQGGSGGDGSVSVGLNDPMPSATAPTRTGYTFGGYYTGTGGTGTQYYAASMASARNWNIASNTTLYAKWSANTYSVTLDRQSGSGGSSSVTATFGSAMPSATAPTRTGYAFGGYYTGTGGTGTQYYTAAMASVRNWDIASNTTLYAKWIGSQYTLTFDRQSGSGGTTTATATFGSAMPSATAPTRTGYTFGGYYSGTGGSGTQYYTAAMASARNWDIASNTTLYAKWTANQYSIVFNANGGSGSMANQTVSYNQTVTINANQFTRSGYAFAGWSTSSGGIVEYNNGASYTHTLTSNRNFYAVWVAMPSMIAVQAKTFPTGTTDGGSATVSIGYSVANTEITYRLWKTVYDWASDAARGASRYYFQNSGRMGSHTSGMTDLHPVTMVSWRDCLVWCNALTEWHNATHGTSYSAVHRYSGAIIRDSRDSNATACDSAAQSSSYNGYRMLTTFEWELAARWRANSTNVVSGYTSPYFTKGNSASHATASYSNATATGTVAWYNANTTSTQPVQGKAANSLLLYDVSGNVSEWTFSLYGGNSRSARGGSWQDNADILQMGNVYVFAPTVVHYSVGFRIAKW